MKYKSPGIHAIEESRVHDESSRGPGLLTIVISNKEIPVPHDEMWTHDIRPSVKTTKRQANILPGRSLVVLQSILCVRENARECV